MNDIPIQETESKLTPMMEQWQSCKLQAKDAVLLFRMGDFYEAFHEDAALIAKELDLTLTKRQEIPMSGIPHHTAENYIDRLVSKGHRVAIAEQTSDPKASKGLVKREVVKIVTAGTVVNSSLLSEKSNNFFACLTQVGSIFGLALLDLTTAEFRVAELETKEEFFAEVYKLSPSEILTSKRFAEKHTAALDEMRKQTQIVLNIEEDWRFEHQMTCDFLVSHFRVHSLDGFGFRGMTAGIHAAGATLLYLQDILCLPIHHIQDIHTFSTANYMGIDRASERHLELIKSQQDGSRRNTLLSILDKTLTPMGARRMTQWIKHPLLDLNHIQARHQAVEVFLQESKALETFQTLLESVKDLERLMMRISTANATPRDLVALRLSLEPMDLLKQSIHEVATQSLLIAKQFQDLSALPELTSMIAESIVEDPPMRITEGKIFRDGFHKPLDELREICRDSKAWLARYQTTLREESGIKTLKVGFNRMFGYYIEVSKGQTERVPENFQRRQTLVNAERYITPELKEYEQKALTAEERISAIESELFLQLRLEVAKYAPQVLKIASALSTLDCLQSFAYLAKKNRYVKPEMHNQYGMIIREGRHPVIEASNLGESFIPNDTVFHAENERLLLITGPNMAGKSTYIRQVGLIAIMAQAGSFVPAKEATLGLIDKVFTRIGASDDLSRGQSTFMVEMSETANILRHATSRSLVILDEIGRGTSTYDGISIAWSIAEFLLMTEGKMAKTLFATHYWELTKLEEKVPGAANYNVAVHEHEGSIAFLRKIVRGGTDKSYGIHVGQLAGLPLAVIERAKEILVHLEENANRKNAFEPSKPKPKPPTKKRVSNEFQLKFFE